MAADDEASSSSTDSASSSSLLLVLACEVVATPIGASLSHSPRIFITESNVFARLAEWRVGAPVGQGEYIFYRSSGGTLTWTQRARNELFGLFLDFAAWHMAPGVPERFGTL